MMEKRGVVQEGLTKDVERRLDGEKRAGQQARTETLDDDATKRLSDAVADKLNEKKPGSST